ncbi:preprotein translocase subunit YajC [Halobacillus shinanisalinarum]|uniref:Preprotein translocase subunit YajC n=1 Tax=Halobacillus shinanisalinarum TaxID=2932258 RepID=A0ABY4H0G2_9BACI|nr:preprotein translocase subunit YajC [Halobacillus shinanisalinarum]UOQ93848.1 preprotein translocase subunit YajC [Halobacillus shinanisalinarum]
MDTLVGLLPIILMFVIFYFLLIRPQQKKQKKVQQMQTELQKGDRIITIGGLHGTIHALDEGTLVITTQDGTQMKFDRSSIRERLNQD